MRSEIPELSNKSIKEILQGVRRLSIDLKKSMNRVHDIKHAQTLSNVIGVSQPTASTMLNPDHVGAAGVGIGSWLRAIQVMGGLENFVSVIEDKTKTMLSESYSEYRANQILQEIPLSLSVEGMDPLSNDSELKEQIQLGLSRLSLVVNSHNRYLWGNMNHTDLAKEIGVTRQTTKRVFDSDSPNVSGSALKIWARALQMTGAWKPAVKAVSKIVAHQVKEAEKNKNSEKAIQRIFPISQGSSSELKF